MAASGADINEITVFSIFADLSLWGIGLALAFGAFWLILLSPNGIKRSSRWLLSLAGALVFAPSIALVQLPLQGEISRLLVAFVGTDAYLRDIAILSIPAVLLSGFVQEAAKIAPIAVFAYSMRNRKLMPRFALSMGALVGLGYGVVEAQWLMNSIFASGFTFDLVATYGLLALSGFWERFFTVAFHTASGAVLGWGVGRGKWWLFYLMAAIWHSLLNYPVILVRVGALTSFQVEFIIAVMADLIFIYAFLLRWREIPGAELEKMLSPTEAPSAGITTETPVIHADVEPVEASGALQGETPLSQPDLTRPVESKQSETLAIPEKAASTESRPSETGSDNQEQPDKKAL